MIARRIVARVVDSLLLSVLALVLFSTVWASQVVVHENVPDGYCQGQETTRCFQSGPTAVELGASASDGIYIVMIGYWVMVGVVEGLTGVSVGKRILRLQVVGNDGNRVGPLRGAVRGLFMIVDLFFLCGLILMALTRPHRRIGDFAARTLVVAGGAPVASSADAIAWDEGRGSWVHTDRSTGIRHRWDADRNEWVAEV